MDLFYATTQQNESKLAYLVSNPQKMNQCDIFLKYYNE